MPKPADRKNQAAKPGSSLLLRASLLIHRVQVLAIVTAERRTSYPPILSTFPDAKDFHRMFAGGAWLDHRFADGFPFGRAIASRSFQAGTTAHDEPVFGRHFILLLKINIESLTRQAMHKATLLRWLVTVYGDLAALQQVFLEPAHVRPAPRADRVGIVNLSPANVARSPNKTRFHTQTSLASKAPTFRRSLRSGRTQMRILK